MHEKHIVDDLIAKIQELAGDKKVIQISVWLGALSHMTPTHFQEHFEFAAHGTIAQHAKISVELSEDIHHPQATRIILRSIEVE